MRQIAFLLVAVAMVAGVVGRGTGYADDQAAPVFITNIPPGYREGKLPFPDGAIIAALHYRHVPSEENNKVFGRSQSFVAGPPTNIQFMVKGSTKFAATGGWGFAHFQDGKPGDEAFMKTCFPCHNQAKASDLVFTRYAP